MPCSAFFAWLPVLPALLAEGRNTTSVTLSQSMTPLLRLWATKRANDLYYNLEKGLLIAGLCPINAFPFHRGSPKKLKMVTTVWQEQQVRKAAVLLSFEFRSRCYKLSCKWSCRNDFLPRLHNLLALYLDTQLRVGCPRRREKALCYQPTY